MSGVMHPVGPEEPRVYWIRRAAVVVVVVLLVALALWFVGLGRGTTTQGQPVAPEPSAPAPATPASPAVSPSPSATPGGSTPSPSPTPTGTPDCATADLRVTLTGAKTIESGKATTFDLSVINGGSSTCKLSVGPDNFELRVYSGADKIFSTKQCVKSQRKLSETVAAQKAVEWKASWTVQRTRSECQVVKADLGAGTYVATAELTGVKPAQLVMNLR